MPMSYPKIRKLLVTGLGCAVVATPARACGPFFPNQLLFNGGASVTWAPVADFTREINRITPPRAAFVAQLPAGKADVFDQSAAVDLADLREALIALHTPEDQRTVILAHYATARVALAEYSRKVSDDRNDAPASRPAPINLDIPDGLPPQFAQYIRGVVLYHNHKMHEARAAWEAVLTLPPQQRRQRCLWAQFMIGKSYLDDDPAKAVAAFAQVRELVKQGLPDSLGLAAASLGWEAQAEFRQEHDVQAIKLYMDQWSVGDPTAMQSLAIVCGAAFASKDPRLLNRLAGDALAARVLTAYAVAQGVRFRAPPRAEVMRAWLAAVEASGTARVVGAERMAWGAYQAGDMEAAQRWINKAAPDAPMVPWIQAKLLLRAGSLDAAAGMMARAARSFPEDERWADAPGTYDPHQARVELSPARRAGAELGVLELGRGHYVDALDQLLKSGWWLDAAYVAERVVTEDELITYVERNCSQGQHPELGHLLARRLTRSGRWKEARPYFPNELRLRLDEYVQAIREGHNAKLAAEKRAACLWQAARIARKDGMPLMGSELTPDGFTYDGQYNEQGLPEARRKLKDPLLPPRSDELQRSERSAVVPARRWHYRYIAAEHAWAAAQLMPDDTDSLAAVLCEAGGWLKADPKLADRFYKALVTRCRNTELGRQAEQKHWFPEAIHKPKAATAG
jgi:hypothetical protein